MDIGDIIDYIRALGGVLVLEPQPGDGSPEISWGDVFFYYAPDGVLPRSQPFATIVTKDYPDDRQSHLDRPGAFRLNIGLGKGGSVAEDDPAATDALFPHPVYGRLGWVSVVNPGPHTSDTVRDLLRTAHDLARTRHHRKP